MQIYNKVNEIVNLLMKCDQICGEKFKIHKSNSMKDSWLWIVSKIDNDFPYVFAGDTFEAAYWYVKLEISENALDPSQIPISMINADRCKILELKLESIDTLLDYGFISPEIAKEIYEKLSRESLEKERKYVK